MFYQVSFPYLWANFELLLISFHSFILLLLTPLISYYFSSSFFTVPHFISWVLFGSWKAAHFKGNILCFCSIVWRFILSFGLFFICIFPPDSLLVSCTYYTRQFLHKVRHSLGFLCLAISPVFLSRAPVRRSFLSEFWSLLFLLKAICREYFFLRSTSAWTALSALTTLGTPYSDGQAFWCSR